MIPVIDHQGKNLYEQIYEFYRDAILKKKLASNYKMPPYRMLATELGVANNTILKAYELLVQEGYLKNLSRRGLFVAKIDARNWTIHELKDAEKPRSKKHKLKFSASVHLVDESNFPVREWRKCSNWALDNISFQYQEHEHNEPLKEQLINYLFTHRGVRASAEQLVIGSGASTLIFWLAFIMRKDFKRIVVEDPGYARIRLTFQEFGYDVKPLAVKEDGIDVEKLQTVKADLICVTPSHQYPTGAAMPVSNRLKILNWAKKNNAFILEDDFDCEFRYKTTLMPALQGLDTHDRVIYIGTFSSALMPSLRVAYLILPNHFPVAHQQFSYLTNTVPYFTRRTLEHFMEQGYWARHLKRMRKVYKAKYEACIRALRKVPATHIAFNNTPSGLNILLHINSRLSESELLRRASAIGILVTPASSFYANAETRPAKPEVLFEFGSVPTDEIASVVAKLYSAWFDRKNKLKI